MKNTVMAFLVLVCGMHAFGMEVHCAIKRQCLVSGSGLKADARFDSCFLIAENAQLTNAFAVVAVESDNGAPARLIAYSWDRAGYNLARIGLANEERMLREFEKCEEHFPVAVDTGLFLVNASTNNVGVASLSVTQKGGNVSVHPQLLHKKITRLGDTAFESEFNGMRLSDRICGKRPFAVAKEASDAVVDSNGCPTLSVAFYRGAKGNIGIQCKVLSSLGTLLYRGESVAEIDKWSGKAVALKCERISGEGELGVTMERKSLVVSGVNMLDLSLICNYGPYSYNLTFNLSGLDNI